MKNELQLVVSFSPFRFSSLRFHHVNYILILLLLPAAVQGTMIYGMYAVRIITACMFSCMLWDAFFSKLFKRPLTIHDGSAAVAGLLLAMLFPPLTPWWTVTISAAAAMFLGKQLFGGIGASPFNSVCIGWAVVIICWPSIIDPTYGSVGLQLPFSIEYPLSQLRLHGNAILVKFPATALFMGKQAGCIGSGAPLPLLIGGCIGIAVKIIPWQIPVSFIAGIAITAGISSFAGLPAAGHPLFHLLTGFSLLGAFFLVTDMSSRPVSSRVMIGYGITAGALTVLFRMFGKFPVGLPFALLIVNMLVPLFDRGLAPSKSTTSQGAINLSDEIKMVIVVTGVAALFGVLIAIVNEFTSDKISQQRIRLITGPAVKAVLSAATNDPVSDRIEVDIAGNRIVVYQGKMDSVVTGIALETEVPGFSGPVSVISGFDPGTGACLNIAIARSNETPGIGSKVNDRQFTQQFAGLDLASAALLKKDGGSIDGISGATISSRAVCAAVGKAQKLYASYKKQARHDKAIP
jgi:Na+-translocating ferredoxin:NAD+ oxidoreductase subunit D